jgi:helix-turn-helix protein
MEPQRRAADEEILVSDLLVKKEAAAYLRCSQRSIDRYRNLGLVKAVKLRGRVLFRLEDLEAMLRKHVEK